MAVIGEFRMYLALKELLRSSQTATWAAHRLRKVRKIGNVEELDRFFHEVDSKYPILNDEATTELQRVCFELQNGTFTVDPLTEEYRIKQMELYLEISGKKEYKFEFESGDFEAEKEKFDFFPYNSRSLRMVSDQLITQGLILRNIKLPLGAEIVEFGAGCGNTSLNLALTGYNVTAVEVGKSAGDVIKYRAKVHGREIDVVNQDMIEFSEKTEKKFDAALFVASFHHCDDHLRLLGNLNRILKKDGVIYFADEPVVISQSPTVPYPWGLRLDGLSLYFIRKSGWFELGFHYRYLEKAVAKFGWKLRKTRSPLNGFANFITAYR